MPTYTFKSPSGQTFTRRLSFSDFDAIKAGEKSIVDDAGEVCELVFAPGDVGFVLKDGVSGGWASKAGKENTYRRARRAEMTRRERDHAPKTRLIPNYQGQEAQSWGEVRDHVRGEKGALSASTYDSLVTKEQQGASS
jgi:hypothetical protein